MKNIVSLSLIACCLGVSSTLAATSEEKPKNILLIMSDDLKASVVGAYGNTVCKTPNIDRLAKSGMVFERSYCQGLACAPSRPSIMTSTYPGVKSKAPTIGEHLQKHGWHTARVGKIFHMGVPDSPKNGDSGLDVPECWTEFHNTKSEETSTPGLYRLTSRGIATREMKGRQGAGTKLRPWVAVEADCEDGSDQADHLVAQKAIDLLRERKEAGKPFFLGVGFFRPHYPMVAPKRFFDMYPHETLEVPSLIPGDLDDIPPVGQASTGDGLNDSKEGRQRMWQAYYASTTFMDEQVGRVLEELDRLGLADSTVVIFTTDHGYHLGEHGFWQKANLHEEVPACRSLFVSLGNLPGGRCPSPSWLISIRPVSICLGCRLRKASRGRALFLSCAMHRPVCATPRFQYTTNGMSKFPPKESGRMTGTTCATPMAVRNSTIWSTTLNNTETWWEILTQPRSWQPPAGSWINA